MRETTGDLFAHNSNGPEAICITTNGYVNAQGANTMGKGCAGEAKQRWPGIQVVVGSSIRREGNICQALTQEVAGHLVLPVRGPWEVIEVPYHVLMFPTKNHWREPSDLKLIEGSARQLVDLAEQHGWRSVVLPRPGCGAGQLSWDDVRPLLSDILDDRFWAITFAK